MSTIKGVDCIAEKLTFTFFYTVVPIILTRSASVQKLKRKKRNSLPHLNDLKET